jgi:hypothetical protein
MRIGTFTVAAGMLALGLATWTTPVKAQGPLYDQIKVNLPYTVTVGDKTLQPGDYIIQQMRDSGGAGRVLLVYGDNGRKFETSAMTIPALDQTTPDSTQVILHHFGPDYYFDRIWVQGKNYGYEFPLPSSVKEREKERMQPVSVTATYQAVPQNEQAATTQPQTATEPQPVAEQPAPPPETAEQTPPPPTTQETTPPNIANREMPETSAGWLMMLLGGTALSGTGLMLRRKR